MVPYLLRLFHAFDGDLAEIVVLGEIAQRNASRFFDQRRSGEPREPLLEDETRRLEQLLPCNAPSVAESTGVPRETVRRKVSKLIARGWIAREADGFLNVTPALGDQFEAFNLGLSITCWTPRTGLKNWAAPPRPAAAAGQSDPARPDSMDHDIRHSQ